MTVSCCCPPQSLLKRCRTCLRAALSALEPSSTASFGSPCQLTKGGGTAGANGLTGRRCSFICQKTWTIRNKIGKKWGKSWSSCKISRYVPIVSHMYPVFSHIYSMVICSAHEPQGIDWTYVEISNHCSHWPPPHPLAEAVNGEYWGCDSSD